MRYLRGEVRVMAHKCKQDKVAYDKAYRAANIDKITTRMKAYRKANKEKIKALKANWRVANLDKINAREKAYREANKEKIAAKVARRRALKRKQIPTQMRDCPIEKKRLYHTYKLCALFTQITGVQHHVDHMWPLFDGGPHWSGNLQIITAKENINKAATVDPNIKATIQEMLIEEEQMRYDQH